MKTISSGHPCVQAILTVSANIASVDLQVEAAQLVLRCCSVLPRQEQNKHDIGGAITSSIWLAAARLSLGVISSFETAVSLQLQESNEMVRNDDRLTVLAVALETLLVDNTLLDACTSCANLLLAVASGAAAASFGALASAAFALQVRIGRFCAARLCCHAIALAHTYALEHYGMLRSGREYAFLLCRFCQACSTALSSFQPAVVVAVPPLHACTRHALPCSSAQCQCRGAQSLHGRAARCVRISPALLAWHAVQTLPCAAQPAAPVAPCCQLR